MKIDRIFFANYIYVLYSRANLKSFFYFINDDEVTNLEFVSRTRRVLACCCIFFRSGNEIVVLSKNIKYERAVAFDRFNLFPVFLIIDRNSSTLYFAMLHTTHAMEY